MSVEESEIKKQIREYLIDEGILRTQIPDSEDKLEFGFKFIFPPGPKGHMMVVFKPKSKDLIIISAGTQISKHHVKALNSLGEEKKLKFFMELRKLFLLKNVFFRIDIQNYRYEISDQFFLKPDYTISKDKLFKSVRKVFNSTAYSNILLNEFCIEKLKPDEVGKFRDFTSDSDFSLYS
jgi:hypothetical protein